MGNLKKNDSPCFRAWSNTYSPKSKVALVPIWQINLARDVVIHELKEFVTQLGAISHTYEKC